MLNEILGNYRVIREIGIGGMGAVYAAKHLTLGKTVAIKVLLPQLCQDPVLVRRFFNEARAATRIRHPGIVEIHGFGQHHSGTAYIVMELLEGETLAARLRSQGRMSWPTCLRLLQQVASALVAAHGVGIIHRDLKPDNIFLCPHPAVAGRERVKLLDFGIAKLVGDSAGASLQTRSGTIVGTPRYMAPEQCRANRPVDHRADLYSVGCIAFEMLCGRPPFVEARLRELLAALLYAEPPRPSALVAEIPPAADALILRLLAKDPDARPRTAAELALALQALRPITLARDDLVVAPSPWPSSAPRLSAKDAEEAPTLNLAPPKHAGRPAAIIEPPAAARAQPAAARAQPAAARAQPAAAVEHRQPEGCPIHPTGPVRKWRHLALAIAALGSVAAGVSLLVWAARDRNSASLPRLAVPAGAQAAQNRWIRITPPQEPKAAALDVAPLRAVGSESIGLCPERHATAPRAPYDLHQHEVTWAELAPYLAAHPAMVVYRPAWMPDSPAERARLPATGVPWHIANQYCRGLGGRLPSEAEWDYAARASESRSYAGSSERLARPPDLADNALYDMIGTREWVADVWQPDLPGEDNALCTTGACRKGQEAVLDTIAFRCAKDVSISRSGSD